MGLRLQRRCGIVKQRKVPLWQWKRRSHFLYLAEDILAVISSGDPRVFGSSWSREIRWLLENAEEYGYRLEGNSWLPES